ncbi:MAG: hypothetical protein IPN74_13425 [Haliscomenobacter sp.]|nr:hypothetical protein [Haliscomenobacter sp.]
MKITLTASFLLAFVFFACNKTPKPGETPPPAPSGPEAMCFALKMNQDITACSLTIDGDSVTGFFAWEPFERDGGRGSLNGSKSGDVITVNFHFMIEGSIQQEEMMFKLENGKLLRAVGELEDQNDVMVIKDKASVQYTEVFEPVDCSEVAEPIQRAKEVAGMIEAGQ